MSDFSVKLSPISFAPTTYDKLIHSIVEMSIYNHCLFNRYRLKVFSFAVLGDDNPNWKPTSYGYSQWGFTTHLQFPSVKLLDYSDDTLAQSKNPFAIIIMAHLQTQATQGNSAAWYKMGLNAEEITERMTHVTLVQVYAALTYYHANREEIEGYIAAEKADYQRL
ncbi:hypothetical protein SR1949_44680 [Sphaerospermopsis reniformis]|uniref:Uncharacterized protein n=2 Tax=Sphaerospermopsis reniformis TaxID=531300 RepID=A0A480A4A2_9CYAN|nr:hypothetical protein SR1949_44680 [Sphaerospermopsis reniformis]